MSVRGSCAAQVCRDGHLGGSDSTAGFVVQTRNRFYDVFVADWTMSFQEEFHLLFLLLQERDLVL